MKYALTLFLLTSLSCFAAKTENEPTSVKCLKAQLEQNISLEDAYQNCSVEEKVITK